MLDCLTAAGLPLSSLLAISEAKPILDARLPDGSRIAAVIPPCSVNGTTITIRKFAQNQFSIQDLIRLGTLDGELARILQEKIKGRSNILISGGTSTGKTTLLNVLTDLIP